MKLEQALEKLFSLHQFGIKLGLDNIKNLLSYLGNPEKNLKAFHLAGSNGKGSTASFINSILIEAGYKTGLYTSPHFVKFNERIRVNGVMVDDDFVLSFMEEMEDYIEKNSPTFFELTTAMAFKYFADNKVDYAVIETGLGGRLDATNVLNPLASIITTISKEHTNILGDSLEKIAYEKGEIIKSGSKCFIGSLVSDAREVIQKKCKSVGVEFFELDSFLEINSEFVKLSSGDFHLQIYKTPLHGFHQLKNSALAVLSIQKTLNIVDKSLYNRAIENVIENSGIQCRYEFTNITPDIIFDSAHNAEGVESFVKEFKGTHHRYKKKFLIFGVMKDKNLEEMLGQLKNYFNEIYITTINYERAATIEELEMTAGKLGIRITALKEPVKFINDFKKEGENNCLVILGSMYLLGKIKEDLLNNA